MHISSLEFILHFIGNISLFLTITPPSAVLLVNLLHQIDNPVCESIFIVEPEDKFNGRCVNLRTPWLGLRTKAGAAPDNRTERRRQLSEDSR